MTKMEKWLHKITLQRLIYNLIFISSASVLWPPGLGFCQLVQVPCLGGCGPCQDWLCPRRRWRGGRKDKGCPQGSGLWRFLVTLALFEFKPQMVGRMKQEDDHTPGTRPERPWLSWWSAISTLFFPFLALVLSSSHSCSTATSRLVERLGRSAWKDQLTMNHHRLAQAQTGGILVPFILQTRAEI